MAATKRLKVDRLKEIFTAGTRIKLKKMINDPHPVPDGTLGTVRTVDDLGTIHCRFDNGQCLGVIPGVDLFYKQKTKRSEVHGKVKDHPT